MVKEMRKAIVFSAVALLAFSAVGVLSAGAVPRKAPEFVIQMPDGSQKLLSSYRGKTVVLALMFTTCTHCQKTAPQLAHLQDEYGQKGVQFLGAAFDGDAKNQVATFVKLFGVNFPCGFSSDANVLTFLGLPPKSPVFVPMLVFIDKNGTVRAEHRISGDEKKDAGEKVFYDDIPAGVRAELDKMLKPGPTSAKK
jgi:peroxiredoxin